MHLQLRSTFSLRLVPNLGSSNSRSTGQKVWDASRNIQSDEVSMTNVHMWHRLSLTCDEGGMTCWATLIVTFGPFPRRPFEESERELNEELARAKGARGL